MKLLEEDKFPLSQQAILFNTCSNSSGIRQKYRFSQENLVHPKVLAAFATLNLSTFLIAASGANRAAATPTNF